MSPQLQIDIELITEADVHDVLYGSRGSLIPSKASGGLNFGLVEYVAFCYYFADGSLVFSKSCIQGVSRL